MNSISGGSRSFHHWIQSRLMIAASEAVGFCWYCAYHCHMMWCMDARVFWSASRAHCSGQIDFIVQAYDTALTTKERSDFTVCQTWGVFKDSKGVDNVILLNSVRDKYEFPELKVMALEQAKEWEPDSVIVEAKASGQPLIDEMRRSGIFVQDFSPGKGQDKIARMNAVADMFASGQIWFPETAWASTVVEEILAFPSGEHDDCVDACTLALMRVRKGGMMRLVTDKSDDEPFYRSRRPAYY